MAEAPSSASTQLPKKSAVTRVLPTQRVHRPYTFCITVCAGSGRGRASTGHI